MYGVMLLAYPPAFRRTYAGEMTTVFRDGARAALAERRLEPVLMFVLRTLVDWLHAVVHEQRDAWGADAAHPSGQMVISLFAPNNVTRVPDVGDQSGMVWLLLSSLGAFLLVDGWLRWIG
jgi:hypothetical protein